MRHAGTRLGLAQLRACLLAMDASRLGLDQLKALLRAVPTSPELQELQAYLAGKHAGRATGQTRCQTRLSDQRVVLVYTRMHLARA